MKYLGQHFLKNKSAIKKIVDALDLQPGDTIIEIGAGHGELTEQLISQNSNLKSDCKIKLIAIEKDERLARQLKEKFARDENIEIILGDALKFIPSFISSFKIKDLRYEIKDLRYKIVGNIPYYITGKLLRILSELNNKPSLCVFALQKEVAERICAGPKEFSGRRETSDVSNVNNGTKGHRMSKVLRNGMNRLAAITQFWAKPEILFYISRKDFQPMPDVDSAIIKMVARTDADLTRTDADRYYKTVRILFQQPRKTILNNLHSIFNFQKKRGANDFGKTKSAVAEALRRIGINPQNRPQELTVEQIEKIADLFNF